MAKSFYDLDYIIDISEKRLAEYTVLYQKVLERLTNIILIYSALGIFLISLIQHMITADVKDAMFYVIFAVFVVLLMTSLVYFVRLLLAVDIAYLDPPKKYYESFKADLEFLNIGNHETVNDSYAVPTYWTCRMPLRSTAGLSAKRIPIFTMRYSLLYCRLCHKSYVWDSIWPERENNVHLSMGKDKKNTEKLEITTTSNLPGLKGVPVIVGRPMIIKENSSRPSKK